MAIKTSLRLITRRISRAVRESAARLGLAPGDYALVGSYDKKSDRISLTFGTNRTIDEDRLYSDILQEIRKSFPESPQITMFVGLVIRRVQNLDDIYINSFSEEDEEDLTEMLERTLDERP